MGRRIAKQVMGKEREAVNPDTIRYALSMIHLESKLQKDNTMLSAIGRQLSQVERQKEHFDSVMHENMVAGISGLYQDTLSKMSFRIQVHGDSRHLQQPYIANQVRALRPICCLKGGRLVLLLTCLCELGLQQVQPLEKWLIEQWLVLLHHVA